jgi:hypothetical protein
MPAARHERHFAQFQANASKPDTSARSAFV